MPPVDLTTIEGLRAQLDRPLLVGILVVYLIQVLAVAGYAMPLARTRDQRRFLVGMTAAFGIFVIGAVVAYGWILRWLADVMLKSFMPFLLYDGGISSHAAWRCVGAGMLCEIPVLTWVFGRFGIPVLQKREVGYILILIVAAVMAPTPDLLTFLAISIPSIVLYELGLGILRLQRFRGKADDERYFY